MNIEIDFKTLLALAKESGFEEESIPTTIQQLAMDDVPMTPAVIRLGIAYGVLLEGYENGWSTDIS